MKSPSEISELPAEEIARRADIARINSFLPPGMPKLRLDADAASIAAAEPFAITGEAEAVVNSEHPVLAQHEVKPLVEEARRKIAFARKEPGILARLFGKREGVQQEYTRQLAELQRSVEEAAAIQVQYDSLKGQLKAMEQHYALARDTHDQMRQELQGLSSPVHMADHAYSNTFTTNAGCDPYAKVVTTYTTILALDSAINDWPTVEKHFLGKLSTLRRQIQAIECEHK